MIANLYHFFYIYRLTCMHLPFSSKWLYVGTEKGNIHVVNIESFQLSGYTINWNKVIEMWVQLEFIEFFTYCMSLSFCLCTRGKEILGVKFQAYIIGQHLLEVWWPKYGFSIWWSCWGCSVVFLDNAHCNHSASPSRYKCISKHNPKLCWGERKSA